MRSLRALVVAEYGRTCHLCMTEIPDEAKHPHPLSLTLDHILPRSLGGTDELENLRPAHRVCNLRRQNRPAAVVTAAPRPRAPEPGAGFSVPGRRQSRPHLPFSPETTMKTPDRTRGRTGT